MTPDKAKQAIEKTAKRLANHQSWRDGMTIQEQKHIQLALELAQVVLDEGWQDIESAPKKFSDHPNGMHILIRDENNKIWTGRWHEKAKLSNGEGFQGFVGDSGLIINAKHWKPLTQPSEAIVQRFIEECE